MPNGTKLSATPFDYVNVQNAESFVGLTLSKDGESVEVCQLLKRSRITLEAMRRLIHGLCRDFAKLRKSANLSKGTEFQNFPRYAIFGTLDEIWLLNITG